MPPSEPTQKVRPKPQPYNRKPKAPAAKADHATTAKPIADRKRQNLTLMWWSQMIPMTKKSQSYQRLTFYICVSSWRSLVSTLPLHQNEARFSHKNSEKSGDIYGARSELDSSRVP
ncbi:hypothetical protein PTI98_010022 [Pleurotus ostreatus]|nr:hypothetical protein PTI98_010022 [Pleurotus ostreatus]